MATKLIALYLSKEGVREVGNNGGADVIEFQKAVDGRAIREAWCMAFMQWGALQLCKEYGVVCPVYGSEHCNTVYNKTPEKYRHKEPRRGSWFIQKSRTSDAGHTGCALDGGSVKFETIEGNTDPAGGSEGDGVYRTWRLITGTASKSQRGFIDVSQMLADVINESWAAKEAARQKITGAPVPKA